MSGEKLKPCPMCGSGPARSEGRFTNASFSGVEVMDEIYHPYVWCGTCCLRTRSCDNVAEAVEVWNERAHPLPEQPQEGGAAAQIASLKQRLESAEGALRPFANYATSVLAFVSKHQPDSHVYEKHNHAALTLGDLRRARTFLQEQEKQNG